MAQQDGDTRRRFPWGGAALAAVAGGAAAGGLAAARRALTPPDQRPGAQEAATALDGDRPAPFVERYRKALGDDRQRAGLLRFQRHWRAQRDAAFARYDEETGRDFADLRDELAAVKDRVIADLPRYFAQFKAAAERSGAVVYESASPEDANRYISDLCARKGVSLVVKSKSMVSEEIGLNHYLEERGIRVGETDLGEYLVQIAGERPSHIIAPAVHLDRGQTAALLTKATGEALQPDDVGGQVRAARRTLRGEFLAAGLGITGANALVAETGTMLLVTNEGNAELVTSVPETHVVLVGYEKLVPTMADAMLQLRLLGRAATGQPISVYTTFVTGPDRPGKEVHFVFVDNGRKAMAADPDFASALRCIRCGACADICPPYQVVGGHVFGYIYSGAIGLVNTPFHHGLANDAGPQSLCVSCNACATVCPVHIDLPRQILDQRHRVAEAFGMPPQKQAVLDLWARPALFDRAARLAARLGRPLAQPGDGAFLRDLPGAGVYQDWRSLPVPAPRPARDTLFDGAREGAPEAPRLAAPLLQTGATGTTVAYFIQCLTDRLYPPMAEATVRVLQACGARVVVPAAQHCCGLPAFDSGDWDHARAMARQTIEALEAAGADWVVTAANSCAVAIEHDYAHLFKDEPGWRARAEALAAKTLDLTTFLTRVARLPDGALAAPGGPAVTYHHFCQSHNVLGLRDEPLDLIERVMGLELVPLPEANVCCGFGGSVSFDRPDTTRHILARKLANVDQTGASTLVTDNPGCIMNLRGGIDASGRTVRVLHLAELLDERLRAAFPDAFAG
ncbi:MAG TPA: LUD domain-containing protein [Thermomicrobiales bacterium]|nr:LUD domain-containing protein [Thermomicrobiales bacterium]